MRISLATSLESRDGTTARDARLVNAFAGDGGVVKRPGASSEALEIGITKAQLLTYWGGRLVTVYGDSFKTWDDAYVVQFSEFMKDTWNASTFYAIGDTSVYEGVTYYAHIANTGQTPGVSGEYYWQTSATTGLYTATFNGYGSPSNCGSAAAAGYSAWLQQPYKTCATKHPASGAFYEFIGVTGGPSSGNTRMQQWVGNTDCTTILDMGQANAGTWTKVG